MGFDDAFTLFREAYEQAFVQMRNLSQSLRYLRLWVTYEPRLKIKFVKIKKQYFILFLNPNLPFLFLCTSLRQKIRNYKIFVTHEISSCFKQL